MDSEKLKNSFEMQKNMPDYVLKNFCKIFLLFWKINVIDFFDMGDFFQISVISRNTEIYSNRLAKSRLKKKIPSITMADEIVSIISEFLNILF